MKIFDVAILGLITSVMGWGIQRIESVRSSHQAMENKLSNLQGQHEVLKADLMAKLDVVIFRIRALESHLADRE